MARIVAGGKRRGEGSGLGNQALALRGISIEVEELLQPIDSRLSAALNRTDDSLGEVLNLIDSTVELVNRSRGAQHVEGRLQRGVTADRCKLVVEVYEKMIVKI